MRYGVNTIYVTDPRALSELAGEAESAGWDGFFIPDALSVENGDSTLPWYDAEVALAAMGRNHCATVWRASR